MTDDVDADDLRFLIELCLMDGIDPYALMAEELRRLGWDVKEPPCSD